MYYHVLFHSWWFATFHGHQWPNIYIPNWHLFRRTPQQRHTAGAQVQSLGVLEFVVAWKWRCEVGEWVEAPNKMGDLWTLKLLRFNQDLFYQSKSVETPTQNDESNIKHVALVIKHGHFTIHYLNHQNWSTSGFKCQQDWFDRESW